MDWNTKHAAFTVSKTDFLDEAAHIKSIDPSYMTVYQAETLDNWWGQNWMSIDRAKYDDICLTFEFKDRSDLATEVTIMTG